MSLARDRTSGRALVVVLTWLVFVLVPEPALASGTITVTPPASISWTDTLNGLDQHVLAAGTTITVNDSRSSPTGWNVTMVMTQFASTSTPADKLPTTALGVNGSASSALATTAPIAACSGACTLPTESGITYPVTVPISPASAAKIFNAINGTGKLAMTLATDFWLTIPGKTLSHSDYTATATFAIVAGP